MNATRCDAWLREQCRLFGVKLCRPDGRIGTGSVIALLRAMEYEIYNGTLSELERKNYFQAPLDGVFTSEQVHQLKGVLDFLRRWKASPSIHDAKKSRTRLLIETEGPGVVEDLGGTVELLLLNLVNNDDPEARELLFEAIRWRMDQSGFIEE